MLQFGNLSRTRVMETETISKNGASSKSQTSRGNHLIIMLIVFLFSSISSYGQDNYWTESYRIVFSQLFKGGKITLKKKINLQDFRKNPQETIYYKTTFAVDFEYKKKSTTVVIDSTVYSVAFYDEGAIPCMLIEENKQIISIFTNSKASDTMFGMDGFVYRMENNSNKWEKETVFTGANFGWNPYFGISDNGNPELWHFSFAGSMTMLSKRNQSGNWTTLRMGLIRLESFREQYASHTNILITNSSGVDKTSVNENKTTSENKDERIIGVWKMVYPELSGENGMEKIKIITKDRFMWTRTYNNQYVEVSGGTYTFDGETYTESVKYELPNMSKNVEKKAIVKVQFEGNKMLTSGQVENLLLNEIWERVE